MARFEDQDLTDAEFRECDLTRARLIGVVMQDAVIDGLVRNLVVNGVEVTSYVEAELDRRHPVRLLIRSADPADLREAFRQLRADWAATLGRLRGMPKGSENQRVGGEWSAVETLRHLVFVHDSWFRRCCLGSAEPFTAIGLASEFVPDQEEQGLDRAATPSLVHADLICVPQLMSGEQALAAQIGGLVRFDVDACSGRSLRHLAGNADRWLHMDEDSGSARPLPADTSNA
jgi:hypothetical protein